MESESYMPAICPVSWNEAIQAAIRVVHRDMGPVAAVEELNQLLSSEHEIGDEVFWKYRPFLTGSRAYGRPREDSDVDLVILAPHEIMYLLCVFGNHYAGPDGDFYEMGMGNTENFPSASISFGQLNLIVHTSTEKYDAWRTATQELIAMSNEVGAIDRETAVACIKAEVAKITT